MPDEPMIVPGYLKEAHLGDVRFTRHGWVQEAVQYGIESDTNAELADDRASVEVTLSAAIVWHRPDGEQVEGPFELRVNVVGTFAWTQPDRTDEDILGWVEFNAQHLLWPYLRTYVSMITAVSGLPAMTVFTIAVPNPLLGHADEDEVEQLEEQHDPA